jgi:hypothetical protein
VYDRVQRKIDAELSRRSSKEVTERLNAQMDDYIKVSNTKRYGVYRDIIIPEEYDPLTPHEAIIHYANPTKYDARNYGAIRRNSAQFGAIRHNSAQFSDALPVHSGTTPASSSCGCTRRRRATTPRSARRSPSRRRATGSRR